MKGGGKSTAQYGLAHMLWPHLPSGFILFWQMPIYAVNVKR